MKPKKFPSSALTVASPLVQSLRKLGAMNSLQLRIGVGNILLPLLFRIFLCVCIHDCACFVTSWDKRVSNPRPLPYQSSALNQLSYCPNLTSVSNCYRRKVYLIRLRKFGSLFFHYCRTFFLETPALNQLCYEAMEMATPRHCLERIQRRRC